VYEFIKVAAMTEGEVPKSLELCRCAFVALAVATTLLANSQKCFASS
jgi:hypothetical protein